MVGFNKNRYGDKQNKNYWGTQTAHREYIHRKQNKNTCGYWEWTI